MERYISFISSFTTMRKGQWNQAQKKNSPADYRQKPSGMYCSGVNTVLSSTRSLCDPYTYVYSVCIYTRIMGQRCALKADFSNLYYQLCFIFQSHLGTHKQHFFRARWPGKPAPPIYIFYWSTHSWDIGFSAISCSTLPFHFHCHANILSRAKRKVSGHKK